MAEKEFEKRVVDYYVCLSKTDDKLREYIKGAEKPLNSLKNEFEQLRLISDSGLDKADLCSTDGFREKLIFKIVIAIEDEISIILGICSQLNNANQVLKNKFEKLESARSRVNIKSPEMEEMIIGTPYRPRLDLLMEWAMDSAKYYTEMNSVISQSVKNLDYKNEETVINLMESFNEEKSKRANIDRILGFTQFLANENSNNVTK